jgi:hypothetical protein
MHSWSPSAWAHGKGHSPRRLDSSHSGLRLELMAERLADVSRSQRAHGREARRQVLSQQSGDPALRGCVVRRANFKMNITVRASHGLPTLWVGPRFPYISKIPSPAIGGTAGFFNCRVRSIYRIPKILKTKIYRTPIYFSWHPQK